jgi:prepilin-type N-terminal cleavage/methylation domain-containing protein
MVYADCAMNLGKMKVRREGEQAKGFSLTEMVVAIAVAMVLMAIGMPAFLRAYHAYQLTNASSQLSDILRLTRYEAIRLNRSINCVVQPDAIDPTRTDAFADVDGLPTPGPTDKIILLGPGGNIVDAGGVPGTAALLAKANVPAGAVAATPGSMTIAFDSRGAVSNLNVPVTNARVFYLASTQAPEAGFRAVLLMPSGSIQVWSGDGTGNWTQIR